MPKKPLDPNLILSAAPPPQPEPSTWDQMGGWPGATAAATRGLSGLLSPSGGPLGAIISGGGEAAAQLLEFFGGLNKDMTVPQRLGRVGLEAGVGAVPFAKVAKSGQLLRNVLRGGALAGTGEAARESELLGGEGINPSSVGLASAFGGGAAGTMQKLVDFLTGTGQTAAKVAPQILPTDQTKKIPSPRSRGMTERPRVSTEVPYRAESLEAPAATVNPNAQPDFDPAEFDRVMGSGPAVPYGAVPEPPSASFQRSQVTEGAEQARALDKQLKAREEAERAAAIQAEREAAGLKPQTTFAETISAPTADGGKASKTTRYTPEPEDEGNAALASVLGIDPTAIGKQGGPRTFVSTAAVPAEAVSSPVEEPVAQLANFFKSRVDASGESYRGAKAAGDVPKEILGKVHGRALQREGQEAGLPPRGPVPTPAPAPAPLATPDAPVPSSGGDWVQEQLGVVEKLKQLMKSQSGGGGMFGGESGAVDPSIPTHLASAALGGLFGAYADPLGNPLLSGLSGAAVGGLLPAGIGMARQGTEALGDLATKGQEAFSNLPDAKETLLQTIEKIPNVQRFNLLASGPGLTSNAFLGPYGSAITGGLEAGLSGDSRGWDALSEVGNPVSFLRNMWNNKEEALDLMRKGEMGRDEAINPGIGTNVADTVLSAPGAVMTAGDVTARRALQNAGFLEDEARNMTLTSEPTTGYGRAIAHFGSGGDNTPLDRVLKVGTNIMAPFRRTPANIMEQGIKRLPVVGAAIQAMGENPNAREIGAQQLMSAGLTGAGYAAGSEIEDPWWSRETRRALSNVSGRYSLPTSLGYAAGRVENEALPQQRPGTAARDMFPVPATENISQLGNFMFGENDEPKAPRGAIPAILRERIDPLGIEPLFPQEEEAADLPRLPMYRRR